jgi:phosphoserine aminotransferase
MPLPVLEKAREQLLSLNGIGMSVMELSHRSKQFANILAAAEQGIRELLALPQNYRVLFLQGGAAFQFSMIPINFLGPGKSADYVVTGTWGKKAELRFSPGAEYVHYTSNETIDGVEFKYDLDAGSLPVFCDASSNILSRPMDIEKYAFIYAGAQKNIGPSGVTVVIIRDDLLDRVPANQHSLLDYRNIAANGSMANTPNTWGIYLISLVCEWLKGEGGVSGIHIQNEEKAEILYRCIDGSDGFYSGHAERNCRSSMNVTFRLPSPELDEKFAAEAESEGLDGLRGHRTVGGIRASIYNAFPRTGVEALVDFMKDFAARNG